MVSGPVAAAVHSTALDPAALDFAPDLLAIQERPPERLPRVIAWVVMALLALTLLWAALAKRDVIALAQGRLVPVSFTKVLQPADNGVITDILVKEGDTVRAGQVLLRLDARLSGADVRAMGQDVAMRRLSLAHIEAELVQQPAVAVADAPPALLRQVQAQFQARRRALNDALAHEAEAGQRAQSDLLAARQILQKLERSLPSYQQAAEAYRKLVGQGFVGELAAVERHRELAEREQDARAQAATVQGLESALQQSQRKAESIRSQYLSQLENERIETLSQLNRGTQELSKADVKAGLLELRAPTAGVVKDLVVTTRGAVVAAGATLLTLVPVGEVLQAEVLLSNEDVGFVAVGQPARIKVAAYPFPRYGMLDGKVSLISADSLDPRQTPAGQAPSLAYRATIELASSQLLSAATGERLKLGPGMLVMGEIHQGERSVLEYLLSPLRKAAQEAGRER